MYVNAYIDKKHNNTPSYHLNVKEITGKLLS